MPRYYTYLISSLPLLQFGKEPPFSFLSFLERCRDFISREEITLLKISEENEPPFSKLKQPTLKRWFIFEFALRNELAKLRALRKKEDVLKYVRKIEEEFPLYLPHLANQALRNPHPLEAEKILDLARWNFLEELEFGHYFDFDFLIVYALKLQILERWQRIWKADKEILLEKIGVENGKER